MPLSHEEVVALADEINVTVSELVANFAELNEGMLDDAATDAAQTSLERLKKKTDYAKRRLSDLKQRQRHKREMEKKRKDHERQTANESKSPAGRIQLLNGQGRLIGWLHHESNGKVTVYDSRGRLVARELAGITLDRTGRLAGRGRMGLVVLGQNLAA